MAAFDRMTIRQVDRRLSALCEFRDLLVDYYNNVMPVDYLRVVPNDQAMVARQRINEIMDIVRSSMYLAGFSTMVTVRDPAVIGGRSRNLRLLENWSVIHTFNGDPNVLLDFVEQAIGRYKGSRGRAIGRTLNPFVWLNELIAFVMGIPFRLLVSAGLVRESTLESSSPLGLLKALIVFIGTAITYLAGLLYIAEAPGYLNAVKDLVKKWMP